MFVCVDIETTGLEWHRGHKTIQIGIYLPKTDESVAFSMGWRRGEYSYDPKAMDIHMIPHITIQAGEAPEFTDESMTEWIRSRSDSEERHVPVGWNVGSFDMEFLKQHAPEFASLFGYQCLDLNSVVFNHNLMFDSDKREIKNAARAHVEEMAKERPPYEVRWHDAKFDAWASWAALEFIQDMYSSQY